MQAGPYNNIQTMAENAARVGDLEHVKQYFKSGAKDITQIALAALLYDTNTSAIAIQQVIEFCIDNGADAQQIAEKSIAKYHLLPLVDLCHSKAELDFNRLAVCAAENYLGTPNTLEWCFTNGADNIEDILNIAIQKDSVGIIEFCIAKGIDAKRISELASTHSKPNIIRFCIQKHFEKLNIDHLYNIGGDEIKKEIDLNWQPKANNAASKGDLALVALCFSKNPRLDISSIARNAIPHGHLDVVKWCFENGLADASGVISAAIEKDPFNILKWLIINKKANVEAVAREAAASRMGLGAIKLCIKNGAKNTKELVKIAAQNGHLHIVQHCLANGADNMQKAVEIAAQHGQRPLVIHFNENYKIDRSAVRKNATPYVKEYLDDSATYKLLQISSIAIPCIGVAATYVAGTAIGALIALPTAIVFTTASILSISKLVDSHLYFEKAYALERGD